MFLEGACLGRNFIKLYRHLDAFQTASFRKICCFFKLNDIKKLFEKAKNLEILILADNDLENVNNLPKLDLTVLDLSSNK